MNELVKTKPNSDSGAYGDILHLKDLDIDAQFILDNSYAREGDIVLVAGTLVEGIGNSCSDIDVYVITGRPRVKSDINVSRHHRVLTPDRSIIDTSTPEDREVFLIHTALPKSAVKVDVEFKTFDEIESLAHQVDQIFDYACSSLFLLTKRLTDREEVLIHRLFNCIPILGADRFEAVRGKIDLSRYRYLGYRWIASDFNLLLDLLGSWSAGDIDRSVEFAREMAFIQTAAYLRLNGCTNFRRKWLLTYIKNSGDPLLTTEMKRIMYLQYVVSLEDKQNYVLSVLDYVDILYEKAAPLLSEFPNVPSGEAGLRQLVEEREKTPSESEYEAWEFNYRARVYGRATHPTKELLPTFGGSCHDRAS